MRSRAWIWNSRRPKARWHGPADRHRARPRPGACRELGILGELEPPHAMRLQPVGPPDALNRGDADASCSAIMAPVQWVALRGGSVSVRATTRSAMLAARGGTRDGRVLSRRRPSIPSSAKRSCQRQTQVFDLCVWRMISTVPQPSADKSTIAARQTCFCGALRLPTIAFRRRRSGGVSVIEIPGRMPKTCMRQPPGESPPDLPVRFNPLSCSPFQVAGTIMRCSRSSD